MQRIRTAISPLLKLVPDRPFLYLFYFKTHKRWLNLKNPTRYTEIITWLKLNGGLERYAKFVDKYTVREHVAEKIGEEYLIPLLGVYDRFDDIDFDMLPERFVLKATHGCEYNYICKDKSAIDMVELKQKFDRWLSEDFWKQERERQYRYCKPRIVCEAYMEDETGQLRDYKFYCSKGKARMIQVDSDRFTNHKSELVYKNWRHVDRVQCANFELLDNRSQKPAVLPEMLKLAETLARDFPFVRVDLYACGDKIYFGELTFTPGSGLISFYPKATGDKAFADICKLRDVMPRYQSA